MNITLRNITIEDAELIFLWRNEEVVRKYFFDSTEVSWNTHIQWLEDKISSPLCYLLLAELDSMPIGVIRFDKKEHVAEFSIYLAPAYINKGLGVHVVTAGLAWAKENLPEIKHICATILSENVASQKVFKKAGFLEKYCVYEFSMYYMS